MSDLSLKSERRWGQEGTALELGAWRVRAGGLPGPPLSPQRKPPLYLKKRERNSHIIQIPYQLQLFHLNCSQ